MKIKVLLFLVSQYIFSFKYNIHKYQLVIYTKLSIMFFTSHLEQSFTCTCSSPRSYSSSTVCRLFVCSKRSIFLKNNSLLKLSLRDIASKSPSSQTLLQQLNVNEMYSFNENDYTDSAPCTQNE